MIDLLMLLGLVALGLGVAASRSKGPLFLRAILGVPAAVLAVWVAVSVLAEFSASTSASGGGRAFGVFGAIAAVIIAVILIQRNERRSR